jgi:hypothetical protein
VSICREKRQTEEFGATNLVMIVAQPHKREIKLIYLKKKEKIKRCVNYSLNWWWWWWYERNIIKKTKKKGGQMGHDLMILYNR